MEKKRKRKGRVAGPSGGVALEKLTKMVRDLQIAQTRRGDGGQPCDRRPPVNQRCIWCDVIRHARRDCADFGEALRNDVVYLWNGRVHASDIWRMLEVNIGQGNMKRLMEEAAVRQVEAIHYSASVDINVERDVAQIVRLPNGDQVVMGSTPTFHSGI